jgi:hypothetical protein
VASLKFECVQAVGGVGGVDELKGISTVAKPHNCGRVPRRVKARSHMLMFFLSIFLSRLLSLTPKGYVDQTTKETGLGPCLRPQQKKSVSLIVALCAKLGV